MPASTRTVVLLILPEGGQTGALPPGTAFAMGNVSVEALATDGYVVGNHTRDLTRKALVQWREANGFPGDGSGL